MSDPVLGSTFAGERVAPRGRPVYLPGPVVETDGGEPNGVRRTSEDDECESAGRERERSERERHRAVPDGSEPNGVRRTTADDEYEARSDGASRKAERTDATEFTTYTDERYGYSVAHPADWSVSPDSSGVAFDAPGVGSAGAEVFVDEVDGSLSAYVESFLAALAADEHVHGLERLDGRDVWLSGGHGHVVECAYVGDSPDERWRLSYLFALDGDSGYTVGVDWAASEDVGATAAGILDSFSLERTADGGDGEDERSETRTTESAYNES